jgi:peptidoglycan/xylan/chitin deacetylase (PgdA/CDA1 family)
MDSQALRHRRLARRRATRRRRAAALAVIALVAVIVIVLVSGSGGAPKVRGTPARSARHPTASAPGPAARSASPSTPAGAPGTEPVPILMYHVIAPAPAGAPFPGLYVTPSEFAAQMRTLRQAGWHAVTLDQVRAYWSRGAPLGAGKPIVLSFDNGYQSQYTQALPVLQKLGWVGDENVQLTGLPPSQGGLGQGQIRGLIGAGWELDTQGISHANLIALDAQQLHYQVAVARSLLQQRFHVPVNWFCYPSGHYDANVIAAVKAAGYAGSTTVAPGWAHPADDPYRLHRLRVSGGTSPGELLSQIAGIRNEPPAPATYGGA